MPALKFALAAALLASAGLAQANIIQVTPANIGSTFTVDYDGFSDGNVIPGLTGQTMFTLTGATDRSYSFDYTVNNTSSDPIDASRISIFGFNTDPNISGATSTGLFDRVATNSNVPSGFGQVDVCFKGAGGPNCSGGGSEGVTIGNSASGSLTLNFSDALSQLTLSDFFVRYQSIDGPMGTPSSAIGRGMVGGSTGGGSTGGGSTGGTPVPAPAGFGLFALAAIGLFGARRMKNS